MNDAGRAPDYFGSGTRLGCHLDFAGATPAAPSRQPRLAMTLTRGAEAMVLVQGRLGAADARRRSV